MPSSQISARLSPSLAAFVEQMVGPNGRSATPCDDIRDLIRRDMERGDERVAQAAILNGDRDLAEGAVFTSTGDFASDTQILARNEARGWR